MTDADRQIALALIEATERQLHALKALLGGQAISRADLQAAGLGRPSGEDRCPSCGGKGKRTVSAGFGAPSTICGACGYAYST